MEEFDRLPALIRPGAVRAMTGWSRHTLRALEEEGKLSIWRTPKGHRRYYKQQLQALMQHIPHEEHVAN